MTKIFPGAVTTSSSETQQMPRCLFRMDIPEVNWRTAQLLCGRISKAGAATRAAAGNMGGLCKTP